MAEEDPLEEFLRVLQGGEGSPRMKELARAMAMGIEKRERYPTEVEARGWLAGNKRDLPLGLNHFARRSEAEQLVEDLYSAGALRVSVGNISYEDVEKWGGPYSDTLLVALPQDPEVRHRIVELSKRHCEPDFLRSDPNVLSLWWD